MPDEEKVVENVDDERSRAEASVEQSEDVSSKGPADDNTGGLTEDERRAIDARIKADREAERVAAAEAFYGCPTIGKSAEAVERHDKGATEHQWSEQWDYRDPEVEGGYQI